MAATGNKEPQGSSLLSRGLRLSGDPGLSPKQRAPQEPQKTGAGLVQDLPCGLGEHPRALLTCSSIESPPVPI